MFKKFIVGAIIGAMSVSAFAGQDVYITFKDGKTATYKNLDDELDNDGFNQLLMRDFGRSFNDVDHNRSRVEETKFMDTGWGTALKVAAVVVVGAAIIKALPGPKGFPCVLPTDRAKDGSLCGARASSVRPGGR